METSTKHKVNLGCGWRFNPNWTNFDLAPISPQVQKANFLFRIPLPDKSASCVYHSHTLEHLSLKFGKQFLKECQRVLEPGGILRIVVPDLEKTVRDYVDVLDRRRKGEDLQFEHLWLLTEFFDQMVRTRRGGLSGELMHHAPENPRMMNYIAPRLGAEGVALRKRQPSPFIEGKFEKVQNFLGKFGFTGKLLADLMHRRLGENHQWMYDEIFLGDVLRELGYVDIQRHTYNTSSIPGFTESGIDQEPDGTPYKGTSLFMEARRAPEGK